MSENDLNSEETIFSTALRFAPCERAAYLEQACGGDPALRQRIENLLQAQPQLGTFMEDPLDGVVCDSNGGLRLAPVPEEGLGTRIGRYQLLQKLGEGGCGVVYMAEQEEPVRRRVALKVIKLGMDTKSVIARFEAERQALAMMDHPNIAKVLDGGATETGRPYFVMELVRGIKITEFCDQNRLSTRERLNLFIQVCQAVQHAHQKGIIHRDLKPSNILVTIHDPGERGVPMIIDFGIAKATQGRLTDQTLFTAFEQFLGTPAYMSPEQTLMTVLDVDTRSDIYSLGVLLYELLTGRTPFDAKELLAAGFEEMRSTIREKEPLRPSTRLSTLLGAEQTAAAKYRQTEPPKLIHLIRGDLDWIVMKALEKDRARRYETANALAMDLQRHLNNEPVAARPPSKLYEFQKTVRRHKLGFAATAAVIVALALGVVLTSWEAKRAERNAELVRRNSYVADMNLAARALEEGDLGTARAHLRAYIPEPGAKDLRNWEWRYLAKQSEGRPHVALDAPSSMVSVVRFVDDDTLLTAGIGDWRAILWKWRERQPTLTITNRHLAGGFSSTAALAQKRKALWYRVAWGGAGYVTFADLKTGEEIPAFVEADAPIRSLSLSPDEQVLAVACKGGVEFWDVNRQARLPNSIHVESSGGCQAVFSPDGKSLAVADGFGNLDFWEYPALRRMARMTNAFPAGEIGVDYNGLTFSPDGQWLVRPCGDHRTRVWRTADHSLFKTLTNAMPLAQAVFSPNGRRLALIGGWGRNEPAVHVWDTVTWSEAFILRGHTDPVTAVDFSPDSQWLATGARNGEVHIWALQQTGSQRDEVWFPDESIQTRVAADGSGFLRVTCAVSSNGVAAPGKDPAGDAALRVMRGMSSNLVAELWSPVPLKQVSTVPADGYAGVSSLVLLPGARAAALGGVDGSLRIVGLETGQELLISNAHSKEIYLLDVSFDGSTLATHGWQDGRVRFWRLPSLEPMSKELLNSEHIHCVKLAHDGKLLAGFTGPGDMGVWEIPSLKGPPMWRALAPFGPPTACAISAESRFVAAATSNGELFMWELATRKRMTLPRALTVYHSLAFSPDGSRLAAASDHDVKMFDTTTGQEVFSSKQPGVQLAFTRDGERLLAVNNKAAFVLHAPPLEQIQYGWLKEKPSQEAPPYRGPDPNYSRPDRPRRDPAQ